MSRYDGRYADPTSFRDRKSLATFGVAKIHTMVMAFGIAALLRIPSTLGCAVAITLHRCLFPKWHPLDMPLQRKG